MIESLSPSDLLTIYKIGLPIGGAIGYALAWWDPGEDRHLTRIMLISLASALFWPLGAAAMALVLFMLVISHALP